jgi:histidinol-phosphatase
MTGGPCTDAPAAAGSIDARALRVALVAADEAAALIRRRAARRFATRTKADGSFVTSVDTAAERLIVGRLRRAFPKHDVTGEECGASDRGSAHRWFVDPIDGTLAFTLGLPFFGTILALCRDTRPVVAVIALPMLGRKYHATAGGGAWRGRTRLRLDAAPGRAVRDELIATGDRYTFAKARALARYERLVHTHAVVRTIPDCVGHTLTVEGAAGAMVDYHLNYWDFAATELLVREAGGRFVVTGSRHLRDGRRVHDVIFGRPRVVTWLLRTCFG